MKNKILVVKFSMPFCLKNSIETVFTKIRNFFTGLLKIRKKKR